MIAGLRPSSQNVIFKQNLSGQARKKKKKRQKAKLDGFVKRKRYMHHFRLIWIKGTWIFLSDSVIYSVDTDCVLGI